jgi:hypothetical protein
VKYGTPGDVVNHFHPLCARSANYPSSVRWQMNR